VYGVQQQTIRLPSSACRGLLLCACCGWLVTIDTRDLMPATAPEQPVALESAYRKSRGCFFSEHCCTISASRLVPVRLPTR
jgi:hypothetical protein